MTRSSNWRMQPVWWGFLAAWLHVGLVGCLLASAGRINAILIGQVILTSMQGGCSARAPPTLDQSSQWTAHARAWPSTASAVPRPPDRHPGAMRGPSLPRAFCRPPGRHLASASPPLASHYPRGPLGLTPATLFTLSWPSREVTTSRPS